MLLCRQNPMVIMVFIQVKPLWETFCIFLLIFFLRALLKETWIFWVKGLTFFLNTSSCVKVLTVLFHDLLPVKENGTLFISYIILKHLQCSIVYSLYFLHPFYGQMIYYAQLTSSTVERRNNLSGNTSSLSRSHLAMWYEVEMTLLMRSQICMNMQGLKLR